MSKTRDTGFLGNVVKVDASGNVSFVSGSTTLATINTSGQLSGSSPVLSSSYASNAELLDGLDSTVFTLTSSFNAQTASFNAFSASILTYTGSANNRFSSLETTSGSNITRLSALEAATGSLYSYTSSLNNKTASFATTGSNTFTGIQTVNSNLVVTGSITAQTLVVQTVTSSIIYSSGSNIFGNTIGNSQTFTGSMLITGSNALFNVGCVGIGTTSPVQSLTVNGNVAVGGQQAFWLRDDDGFSSNASRRAWAITANYSSFGMLSFFVANATASNPLGATAALNITSGGSVGIGNSNPQAKLQVGGNIIVGSDTCYNLISGPSTGAAIQLGTNSATFDRNLNLGFVTAGLSFGPILTINAQTSNVGIGDCTPDRRLYVNDTSVTQGTFLAYNRCSTFCGTVIEGITDRTSNSGFNLINLKSSTTSMFMVRGDGLACFAGTVSAGGTIKATTGLLSSGFTPYTYNDQFEIQNEGAWRLRFQAYHNGAGYDYRVVQNNNGSDICVMTFICGRITVNQAATFCNNVGIGTSSPAAMLDIYHPTNGYASVGLQGYAGATKWYLTSGISGDTIQDFSISNNNAGTSPKFRISSTGAATFSSTLYMPGSIAGRTGQIEFTNSCTATILGMPNLNSSFALQYTTDGIAFTNDTNGTIFTMNTTSATIHKPLTISCGVINSNSVITKSIGGTMQGDTATYFDFPTYNDAGTGQMFEVKAFFDHYFNFNYGAHYYAYLTTREGSSQALTMFSCPTAYGGCWMAYKSSNTNLRVCKIAGTYVGGGAYWIQVTAKQP